MNRLSYLLTSIAILSLAFGNEVLSQEDDWCNQELRSQFSKLKKIRTSSTWFKVYQVENDVFAIAEPFNFQEVISYLILGEDKALLFDTGMGMNSIKTVVEELTPLPITVLNSHTHYDHIGGNHEFDQILAMNTQYTIGRSENGMDHSIVSHEVTQEAICLEKAKGLDTANYTIKPFKISELITHEHIIDLGNRQLEVIASPGHTPDAIVLIDKENGLMWTGDTFYEGPIWLFDPETDLVSYQESVNRLYRKSKGLKKVFTAHNTPIADPSRLKQLKDAFAQIMKGKKAPEVTEGTDHVSDEAVAFEFEHFSFFIRRDRLEEVGIIKR
ncbi:MBL fold metallo-hydrolase [Roseivirga sp. E12]|uniref:MBL fold metallo-hydrolase n=1 Tax=Roseivirga sp. E12 TaxID=2819237 RepID=UPI001ABCEE44|nr:MBL fold metallo-hydrolase [Roseivirga sp. E12]MBO3698104.1 MBL fold metallo-hydrolase [Roseivirga sp. E12]